MAKARGFFLSNFVAYNDDIKVAKYLLNNCDSYGGEYGNTIESICLSLEADEWNFVPFIEEHIIEKLDDKSFVTFVCDWYDSDYKKELNSEIEKQGDI